MFVRRDAIAIAAAALLAGCAVMEPPSGGPEDKTPPFVVAVVPNEDSAGVGRDVRPVFTFSERIDGESFKNRVLVYPPVEFERIAAKGERLEIVFKSLLPETTFCVVLGGGFRDQHLVPNRQSYVFHFATTASISRGEVDGAVFFKDKPDSNGAAELFAVRGDSLTDMRTTKRARVAFCSRDGRFRFRALPTNEARFLLRAFIDKDGDGYFSEGKEFWLLHPDTIVLRPLAERVSEITLKVIDPNEPGSIQGTIVNQSGLERSPTVRLDPLKRGVRMLSARADSAGSFAIGRVPPGEYLISVFVDMREDTICGSYRDAADTTKVLDEPCLALPDTLRLNPGELRKLDPIELR